MESLRTVARFKPLPRQHTSSCCVQVNTRKGRVRLRPDDRKDSFTYGSSGLFSELNFAGPSSSSNRKGSTDYLFDHVFGPNRCASNVEVFETCISPLVTDALNGFRCTCFAYGYVSSGKTHTMHGTRADPGIVACSLRRLFEVIHSYEQQARDHRDNPDNTQSGEKKLLFVVKLGFVQLYDGKFYDLLLPPATTLQQKRELATTHVELHDDCLLGSHLRGPLSLRSPVKSVEAAFRLLAKGRRALSRGYRKGFKGHTIVSLYLERHNLETGKW